MYTYEALRPLDALVSPIGIAHTGWSRTWAVVFTLLYLCVARTMSTSGRSFVAIRFGLALAEVAILTVSADAVHTMYVPAGIILAADLGLRKGWVALSVPAAIGIETCFLDADARTAVAAGVASVVLAALLGLGFGQYLDLRDQVVDASKDAETQALISASRLAGSNAALMDHGLADLVQRIAALVRLSGEHPTTGDVLAGLKAEVAASTRDAAAYVDDVVRRWVSTRNRTPVLEQHVRVEVAPDLRTMVLLPEQAEALLAQLDRRDPSGTLALTHLDGPREHVWATRRLVLDGELLVIPPYRPQRSWLIAPLPPTAVLLGLWMLAPIAMADTHSVLVPMTFAGAAFAVAVVMNARLRRSDASTASMTFALIGLSSLYGLAMLPRSIRSVSPTRHEIAAAGAIEMTTIAVMLAWPALRRWQRAAAVTGIVQMLVVSSANTRGPTDWRHFFAETMGVFMALSLVPVAGAALDRAGRRRRQEQDHAASGAAAEAFRASASHHLDGLSATCDELDRLAATSARLPSDVRREVRRRCDRAQRLIERERRVVSAFSGRTVDVDATGTVDGSRHAS